MNSEATFGRVTTHINKSYRPDSMKPANLKLNLAELLQRTLDGDEEALVELYKHIHGHLFFTAYRKVKDKVIAEDLVQDFFLYFCEKVRKNELEIDIEDMKNVEGWFHQCVIYRWSNWDRKRRKREKNNQKQDKVGVSFNEAGAIMDQKTVSEIIQNNFGKMDQKIIFMDRKGYPNGEIAEAIKKDDQIIKKENVNINEAYVRKRKSKQNQRLQKLMKKYGFILS